MWQTTRSDWRPLDRVFYSLVALQFVGRFGGEADMNGQPKPINRSKKTQSRPRLLRVEREIYLQVFETAAARFQDGLHFTKGGGIFRQRDRGIEMMNAVMLHAED